MGTFFWAVLSAVMAFLEIIIPGLVTIWFSAAAAITMLLAFFIKNSAVELLIFAAASCILLIFTRPLLAEYLKKFKKENFHSGNLGSKVEITKVVNAERREYLVKFKGTVYMAECKDILKVGEIAKIQKFDGNRAILEKL